jgi:hypothetical protein
MFPCSDCDKSRALYRGVNEVPNTRLANFARENRRSLPFRMLFAAVRHAVGSRRNSHTPAFRMLVRRQARFRQAACTVEQADM